MTDNDRRRTFTVGLIATCFVLSAIFLIWSGGRFLNYQRAHFDERNSSVENDIKDINERIEFCIKNKSDNGSPELSECLLRIVSATQSNSISRHNLKAQQDMAEWALAVFFVSFIAFIATAIGVVFVWLTLRETRRIGEAQMRAYVHLREASAKLVNNASTIIITGKITNSGQTPARKVITRFLWAGEPEPFLEEWWNALEGDSGQGSLGHGEDFHIQHRTDSADNPEARLTREQIAQICSGDMGLWLIGEIQYEDVFGHDHITYVRSRLRERDSGQFTFNIEPTGREDT